MPRNSAFAKQIKEAEFRSSGSYGAYAKAGKVGIKVISRRRNYCGGTKDAVKFAAFKTKKDAMGSPAFRKAKREADILKKAASLSQLPPRFYEVGVYKIGAAWFAGIVMEHIRGKSAARLRWQEQTDVVRSVKDKLYDAGIQYMDGNENNYIYDTAKKIWRIIDFSPGWVRIFRA